jgi:hypothetical protein
MGVQWLKGKACTQVYEGYPENFTFQFGEGFLAVDGLWRIIEDGRVRLTSRDQGQTFGLQEPIDSYREASELLQGRAVVEVRLVEGSADLHIEFEGGRWLEVFTDTSGYESWNLRAPGVHVVACCGGGVAKFAGEA